MNAIGPFLRQLIAAEDAVLRGHAGLRTYLQTRGLTEITCEKWVFSMDRDGTIRRRWVHVPIPEDGPPVVAEAVVDTSGFDRDARETAARHGLAREVMVNHRVAEAIAKTRV